MDNLLSLNNYYDPVQQTHSPTDSDNSFKLGGGRKSDQWFMTSNTQPPPMLPTPCPSPGLEHNGQFLSNLRNQRYLPSIMHERQESAESVLQQKMYLPSRPDSAQGFINGGRPEYFPSNGISNDSRSFVNSILEMPIPHSVQYQQQQQQSTFNQDMNRFKGLEYYHPENFNRQRMYSNETIRNKSPTSYSVGHSMVEMAGGCNQDSEQFSVKSAIQLKNEANNFSQFPY